MVQRNIGHIRRVVLDLLYLAGEGEVQLSNLLSTSDTCWWHSMTYPT